MKTSDMETGDTVLEINDKWFYFENIQMTDNT